MIRYRVTKYNPALRDNNGNYLIDEWTSISDIGRIYNGRRFEKEEYLDVENKYIYLAQKIIEINDVDDLYLEMVEINDYYSYTNNDMELKSDDLSVINEIVNGRRVIEHNEIVCALRLMLRDYFWCEMKNRKGFEITVGYDYYMYMCSKNISKEIRDLSHNINMYIERKNKNLWLYE